MDSSIKYQKFVFTEEDNGAKVSARHGSNSTCLTAVLVISSLLVIAVICTAIGVGVGVSLTHSKSDDQLPPSGLSSDLTVTQEQLQGEYYGTDGGISFTSTVNASYVVLSITTTNGEHVVYLVHPLASNMTMMGVNNTNFMVMEKDQQDHIDYDDFVIPKDVMNLMESMVNGSEKMTDDVLQKLDNKTVNETRQSVLYNLAMSYEATLIIEAAQVLGDRGIMGMDYPSVMTFYQLALRLANARESDDTAYEGEEIDSNLDTRRYQHRQRRAERCRNNDATCPSGLCPYSLRRGSYRNDCFGLCGYGCSCWSFVCGDCCIHQYCLTHDDCCRRRGFWSWSCLSVAWRVLGSQCSDSFRC